MAYEIRELQGSLFTNENRTTDQQPVATGRAKIDGRDFKIAGWTRTSQSGLRYMSLKFEEADDPRTAGNRAEARARERAEEAKDAFNVFDDAGNQGEAGGKEKAEDTKSDFFDDIPF